MRKPYHVKDIKQSPSPGGFSRQFRALQVTVHEVDAGSRMAEEGENDQASETRSRDTYCDCSFPTSAFTLTNVILYGHKDAGKCRVLQPGHAAASAADIEPAVNMTRSRGRASSVGQHRAA
jgi:hypothetical protein